MIVRPLLLTLLAVSTTGCISTLEVAKVPTEEKAENTVSGLRYSLPATFLVVEPDPSTRGGFKVETRLFPNQGETYAIDADTYLGNLTFNVELEEGMLKSVTFNADSAPVAEAAIGAFGEVIKADLDQKKKEREKAEEAAKEKKNKLEGLQTAVADAEKALAAANASVREWERVVRLNPTEKDYQKGLVAARIEQTQAIIALEQARAALTAAQLGASGDTGDGSPGSSLDRIASRSPEAGEEAGRLPVPTGVSNDEVPGSGPQPTEEVELGDLEPADTVEPNEPGAEAEPGETEDSENVAGGAGALPAGEVTESGTPEILASNRKFPTVRGPVFYRLVDTCDPWGSEEQLRKCSVELVAIKWEAGSAGEGYQLSIPVVAPLPKKPDDPKEPTLLVESYPFAPVPITFSKTGDYTRDLPFDQSICGLTQATTVKAVVDPMEGDTDGSFVTKVGLVYQKPTVTLSIIKGALEAGVYKLTLHYEWGDNCKSKEGKALKDGNAAFYFSIPE